MAKEKEADKQRDHDFRMAIVSTLQLLITKGQPVLIAFIIGVAIVMTSRYLAGKVTLADMAFRFIADLRGVRALAVTSAGGLGVGGIAYGILQKNLRKKYEKRPQDWASIADAGTSKSLGKGK